MVGKRGDGVGRGARKVCAVTNYSTVVRVSESYVYSMAAVCGERWKTGAKTLTMASDGATNVVTVRRG